MPMCGRASIAELWTENVTSTVIATRGERLALSHVRFSGRDQRPEAFRTEVLVRRRDRRRRADRGGRRFDLDDIDAAIAELDARYLAGEAAAHAHTWSVIAAATPRSTGTNSPRRRRTVVEHRPPPRSSDRAR